MAPQIAWEWLNTIKRSYRKFYRKKNGNKLTRLPQFQTISSTERASAIQPKMPDYPHLALVAWCKDGYILVDSSLNIPAPLFLEEGKPSYLDMKFRGTWKFELDLSKDTDRRIKVSADSSDSNKPWTDLQKSNATYSYLLKENQNGDESITSQYFLADRKVLIFRLNKSDTNAYRVTLNLIKKQIECTETEPNGNVKAIFTLPFADYLKNPELLENLVDQNSVATQLRMDRDTLLERIRTVIERSN